VQSIERAKLLTVRRRVRNASNRFCLTMQTLNPSTNLFGTFIYVSELIPVKLLHLWD
jgi:hypothetical protein